MCERKKNVVPVDLQPLDPDCSLFAHGTPQMMAPERNGLNPARLKKAGSSRLLHLEQSLLKLSRSLLTLPLPMRVLINYATYTDRVRALLHLRVVGATCP